ncbi:MAG: Zn-ribbon domain-containing OB-fold protein [Bacteroidetes bacterium]|nr:Zn-ribbon domain-containing OB-fold protein [Bacteroidota bacterium]
MQVPKFWREIPRYYRLEAGKCDQCGKITFPSRLVCPECGSREHSKVHLSGRGTLKTFTIIRIPPDGFGDQAPYAIGIVQMDEGVGVMAQITDCDVDALSIGDTMITKFRRVREEGKTGIIMYAYKFVPDVGV